MLLLPPPTKTILKNILEVISCKDFYSMVSTRTKENLENWYWLVNFIGKGLYQYVQPNWDFFSVKLRPCISKSIRFSWVWSGIPWCTQFQKHEWSWGDSDRVTCCSSGRPEMLCSPGGTECCLLLWKGNCGYSFQEKSKEVFLLGNDGHVSQRKLKRRRITIPWRLSQDNL